MMSGNENFILRWKQKVDEKPDALALHFHVGPKKFSYSRLDLFQKSEFFAAGFHARGIKHGEIVIIILDHSPESIFAFLGAILIGAVPTLMPYSIEKQEVGLYVESHKRLFKKIKAKALVSDAKWQNNFSDIVSDCSLISYLVDAEDTPQSGDYNLSGSTLEDTLFLQHSSGTTDLKKGVALTNRCVLAQIDAYCDALNLSDEDKIVSWLPLYHDMGLFACFLLPLITGCEFVLISPFEWVYRPVSLFKYMTEYRATFTWMPNFAFEHLTNSVTDVSDIDLSSMRAFISCSEPCDVNSFERFYQKFHLSTGLKQCALQTCYALAENSFSATQSKLSKTPETIVVDRAKLEGAVISVVPENSPYSKKLISSGSVIPGVNVRILNRLGEVVNEEEKIGEILINGTSLFDGYYMDSERTLSAMQDGWYKTRDIGFFYRNELFVTGRVDDLMIIRGINYFSHEIEKIVNEIPDVKPGRVVAMAVNDGGLGTQRAVVVAESLVKDLEGQMQLAATIKSRVESSMRLQLAHVEIVDPGWVIKSTSGKISRQSNVIKFQEEFGK